MHFQTFHLDYLPKRGSKFLLKLTIWKYFCVWFTLPECYTTKVPLQTCFIKISWIPLMPKLFVELHNFPKVCTIFQSTSLRVSFHHAACSVGFFTVIPKHKQESIYTRLFTNIFHLRVEEKNKLYILSNVSKNITQIEMLKKEFPHK